MLIRGSLCPDGGIVKLAVADDRRLEFTGPALVFESAQEALDGVKAGLVGPGQVVVLRGLGVTGSPGMGMASALVFALDGAGLTGQVAVVTDGQLSGLVNKGIVVGEMSPEAAAGGPLGLVRDGDMISIDVPARTANLEVAPEELAERRAALAANPPAATRRGRLAVGVPAPRAAAARGRGAAAERIGVDERGQRRTPGKPTVAKRNPRRAKSRSRSPGCRSPTGTWSRCTTPRSPSPRATPARSPGRTATASPRS